MRFTKSAEMTLYDATKALLVVSRLVGINPKSHWHKIYTGLILVCELSLFCYIWQFHIKRETKKYHFQFLVHGMQDVCYITSILLIWGSNIFDRRRFMVPLRDFVKVDQSLKGLGGFIDNKGTYRLEILHIIIFGLSIIIFWLLELRFRISLETDEQMYKILSLGLFYHSTVLIACAIVDCSFLVSLFAIRERFKVINSIICRVGTHEWHSRFNFQEISRAHADNDVIRALHILRNRYHDLWEIAYQINDAYGLYLLVGMMTSFALITAKLYIAYDNFTYNDVNIFNALARSTDWVLIYVVKIFALARACESTVAEAKATSVALHKLRMEGNHSPATKEEIRDFLMQLQFEAINFTAYKFFDVDFSLICAILGTACTYLVILIQMGNPSPCVVTVNCNGSIHYGNEHDL